ncbi:MAG TPA: energy transducer TonB [Thermoanaerobaculia bacterium]|nr:energy transducer TonB [Thermoanaerobaculia bacterium]
MIERILFALCSGLCLFATPAPAAPGPADLDRIYQALARGRFAAAAANLQRVVVQTGPSLRNSGLKEKVLRRAIGTTRRFLAEKHPAAERDAARQVLCLSRAFFPGEELPGIENALRVGGGVQRPELIGKPSHPYTAVARRARLQGTVIIEAVIDQEGCARQPRVLKGLPLGLDQASLHAVQSWTFQPATLNGRIVAVYYTLTVTFNLSDPE